MDPNVDNTTQEGGLRFGRGRENLYPGLSASNLPILVDVHDWSALSNSFRAALGDAYELIQNAST